MDVTAKAQAKAREHTTTNPDHTVSGKREGNRWRIYCETCGWSATVKA